MRYQRFGITLYDRERATPGFTLITPQPGQSAYLLGMQGEIVHEWRFSLRPGNYSYLLKNGNLLWAGRT